jgi:hypothetical protein
MIRNFSNREELSLNTLTLDSIHSIREELLKHPVYAQMNTPERVRVFMKHHVFAVWDLR